MLLLRLEPVPSGVCFGTDRRFSKLEINYKLYYHMFLSQGSLTYNYIDIISIYNIIKGTVRINIKK